MSKWAEAMAKLRAARRIAGKCIYCGEEAVRLEDDVKRVCMKCAVKLREEERRRDGWRRRLGMYWTYQEEAKLAACDQTDIGVQNDGKTQNKRAA